jgi:hypothetical protein
MAVSSHILVADPVQSELEINRVKRLLQPLKPLDPPSRLVRGEGIALRGYSLPHIVQPLNREI